MTFYFTNSDDFHMLGNHKLRHQVSSARVIHVSFLKYLIFSHAEISKVICGAVKEATTSDFNACALVPSVSS